MSPRAAARLETLGYRQVFEYRPGKADWFAAGLPREGREAHTPRVGDVARRDVPTCRLDERIGAIRDRMRRGGWDVCVVVDDRRVVLGLLPDEALGVDPETIAEDVMQSGAVTFRPNLGAGEIPDYVKAQRIQRALVTTSDGVLVGLLRSDDLSSQSAQASA